MKINTKSQKFQITSILLLCLVWHIAWLIGLMSGKGFFGNVNMLWAIFFIFIPLILLYLILRYLVYCIKEGFKKHIIPFSFVILLAPVSIILVVLLILT